MSDQPAPVEPLQPARAVVTASAIEATQQAPGAAELPPELSLHTGSWPIPEYQLIARIGSGGFGEVWKAKGPGGFHVALKIVRLHDNDGVDAELRSLELMKEIRHPNVLAPFGAWHRDDHVIIAMELGDRTLLDRLNAAKKEGLRGIPRAELMEYLRDGARGIDHLNSVGIQHRDVKPQNFLLVGGGLKVADFGLAKLLQHNVAPHSGGMTPAYAAPEFLQGHTTARSDQYSLAVTYCQLRGGKLPFKGDQAHILLGHLADDPDLSMLPEIERPIVAQALAKKSEDRWPSCRAFIEALAATPEQPLPSDEVPVVAPVTRVPVAPTLAYPGPAVSTMLADWPKPAAAPGAGYIGTFLTLAIIPFLFLYWPWRMSTGVEVVDYVGAIGDLPATLTDSIGMELVRIAPGKFVMGAEDTGRQADGPAHEVTLTRPFYLGTSEVTQRQFDEVMGANPSHFTSEREGGPDLPVESVTWDEAVEFCRRLSARPTELAAHRTYRLPTEAEWEYVCRAGTTTAFARGDSLDGVGARFDCAFPFGDGATAAARHRPAPVATYPANPWGLRDMHGNVWEWCADWAAPYDEAPVKNPRGPEHGLGRVLRGGGWSSYGWACRSATRSSLAPSRRASDVGFRVAMSRP